MLIMSITGFVLLFIGLWGILTRKHIIKMIIGFSIMDTGIHLIIVALGYLQDRTAPILTKHQEASNAATNMVDPVPQALVLTAIVIGLAVTALMLSFAVRMHAEKKSASIDDYEELKW